MRLHWVLLITFCLVASIVQAQSRFQVAINFSLGFPQGEFADNVDSTGLGLTADLNYRIAHSPVLIGASLGFLQYGSVSRLAPLNPEIPEFVIQLDTTNNIVMGHFLVRYEFGTYESRVRPYAEGLVGFHYLFTQTSIDESEGNLSSTNFDDYTSSFGAGGGVLIGLHRATPGSFRIDLNFGARYLSGGDAEYLTEGAIVREGGNVTYFVSESSTRLVTTNLGVIFSF